MMIVFAVIGLVGVVGVLNRRFARLLVWPLLLGVIIGILKSGEILAGITGTIVALLLFGAVVVKRRTARNG
jgi:hypothetical protein